MKIKAQNTIEIISLASIVLIVVVSVFMFMKSNSTNVANLSKLNNSGASNTITNSAGNSSNIQTSETYTKIDVETAGALSSMVAQMKATELKKALDNKTISDLYSVKSNDDEDIFDLANKLITELNLTVSPFDKTDLSSTTKDSLVDVAVKARERLGSEQNETYTTYTAVLAKIIS